MKRWEPILFPGPGGTHKNFDQGTGERGSRPDGVGYQQIIDELVTLTTLSGLAESAADSRQVAEAVRSQRLNYAATVGGTANAITLTLDPPVASYGDLLGTTLTFPAAAANSGAVTISVDGLAAQGLKKQGGEDLKQGDLSPQALVSVKHDGTKFQIINPVRSASFGANTQLFSTSGSFTVPAGVYELEVEVWAGGGAGGTCSIASNGGGGGGGGGGYARKRIAVTPGNVIPVTVGLGGTGGGAGNVQSGSGGSSSFGAHCSASGGQGGYGPQHPTNPAFGGNGGGGTGGDINSSGGYASGGGTGASNTFGGDGGSASFGGAAGGGTQGLSAGGARPGGGGGGAGSATTNVGASGAAGYVLVRW